MNECLLYLRATGTVSPEGGRSGVAVGAATSEERVVVGGGIGCSGRFIGLRLRGVFGLQHVPAEVGDGRAMFVAVSQLLAFGETRGRGSEGERAVDGGRGIDVVLVIIIGGVGVGHREEDGVGVGFGVKHGACAGAHHVSLGVPARTMHDWVGGY